MNWESPYETKDKVYCEMRRYNVDNPNNNPEKDCMIFIEPPVICAHTYRWIRDNNHRFRHVFTWNRELLDLGENYRFYPHGTTWISPQDRAVHAKSKLLSIIASGKAFAPGHCMRHSIIKRLGREKLDCYGRTYTYVENKITALRDYMFSIVIENSKIDYYFTEKLIDALLTGTVPIYWGCPSIGLFFNPKGFIIIDKEEDIDDVCKSLTPELYAEMLDAVRENFEKAKKYIETEHNIYYYDPKPHLFNP